MINNLIILSNVVNGVPSGNYDGSSLDFDSDGVKAANYYPGQGSIQTFLLNIQGFQGVITLQATLDQQWQAAQWVDIGEFDASSGAITTAYPIVVTGNFTWVRARVTDFQSGTINSVVVSY